MRSSTWPFRRSCWRCTPTRNREAGREDFGSRTGGRQAVSRYSEIAGDGGVGAACAGGDGTARRPAADRVRRLFYQKLGDIHCFTVHGVELRELRLHAWKAAAAAPGPCAIVYKGPFEQVSCECGMVFRRGEKVTVSAMVAGWLRSGPAAEQFVFLS